MFACSLVAVALPNTVAIVQLQMVHYRCDCRQRKTAEKPTYEEAAIAENSCLSDLAHVVRNFASWNALVYGPDLLIGL